MTPGRGPTPFELAPRAIFLGLGAMIAAAGITATVYDLGIGGRVLAAVASGAVAYGLLTLLGRSLGWSHVLNVALSTACGFLAAAWALADSGSPKAAAAVPAQRVQLLAPGPRFVFSGDHFGGVHGTVSGLRQGETLWLMVRTVGDDRPYLMSKPCAIDDVGRFRCPTAYAGVAHITRHRFRILVRIFDSSTTGQAIRDWEDVFAAGESSLPYSGPPGRPGASVVVYRAA